MDFQYEAHRIYLMNESEELLAEITFPMKQDHVEIDHTYVSDRMRGQGVASLLVEEAVSKIRRNGWKCIPTCSYAKDWFERHEEAQDVLV
ncbi:GNAT family N-acetyltransferase [[Eubacterium] hominis]|uniref:GNAT family N-acetyltransferase n=1 Tax=[Eubacterium] hominis TaxID=2764325 RepID=UPI003A4E13FE